jgi:hypothetical protein
VIDIITSRSAEFAHDTPTSTNPLPRRPGRLRHWRRTSR